MKTEYPAADVEPFKLKPSRKPPKAPIAKEWAEQRIVFDFAKRNERREPRLEALYGSMNGLQAPNPGVIVRAKLCGLKPGVPDVDLPILGYAGCPGLHIEIKRLHKNWETCGWKCATEDQIWWRDMLRSQGRQVEVAHGADMAIAYLKEYLDREDLQ